MRMVGKTYTRKKEIKKSHEKIKMLVLGEVVGVGGDVCYKSKNMMLVLKEGLKAYRH